MPKPKYKLTEAAFIANSVWPAGTEIGYGTAVAFDGKPGPHMEPLNAEAEEAIASAGPIGSLDVVERIAPLDVPPVAPGNWMVQAMAAGWIPPAMMDSLRNAIQPQPEPGTAPAGIVAANGPTPVPVAPAPPATPPQGGAAAALAKKAGGPDDAGI